VLGPKSARTGLTRCSKKHLYSITSSARMSNEGGTVWPSALAVFMLIGRLRRETEDEE
jgi:hypothetical protein